jgi:hypothetical protein
VTLHLQQRDITSRTRWRHTYRTSKRHNKSSVTSHLEKRYVTSRSTRRSHLRHRKKQRDVTFITTWRHNKNNVTSHLEQHDLTFSLQSQGARTTSLKKRSRQRRNLMLLRWRARKTCSFWGRTTTFRVAPWTRFCQDTLVILFTAMIAIRANSDDTKLSNLKQSIRFNRIQKAVIVSGFLLKFPITNVCFLAMWKYEA